MKKLLSYFLLFSISLTTLLIPVSAVNTSLEPFAEDTTTSSTSYQLKYGDEIIEFTEYFRDNTRYIEFCENGKENVFSYNYTTSELTINGVSQYIPAAQMDSSIQYSSSYVVLASGSWKQYGETIESSIRSDVTTVAAWGTVVALLLNLPATTAAIPAIATALALTGKNDIYYREYYYYWDPVTTSRPLTATRIMFYSDSSYNNLVYDYDTRWNVS